MQRGVAKGLKVPCVFMITEVSIRCQKNPEVGTRRIYPRIPPPNTPLITLRSKYWKTQVRKKQVRNSAFRKDGKHMYGKRKYGKCKYNANLVT